MVTAILDSRALDPRTSILREGGLCFFPVSELECPSLRRNHLQAPHMKEGGGLLVC